MVKNSSSVKAFWLSFLISGAAVPLGPIAATAQIQDTSTPEVALEGSAVPTATPDAALAAGKIEIPQLAAITAETNAKVDRALPDTDAKVDRALPETDAKVDRALPQTDIAWVNRALLQTDTATVDRALPKQDIAKVDRATTTPEITEAIRELPAQKLEIANSPESQQVAEASKVADISSETGTADDLSIQEDAAQVTSVSQLSDVRPTDWAFQALQSLVERYGCIAGYPDGTFRGNRAMTRYEFAAGLNACLDKVSELIQGGSRNLATREDLASVQRLQEEFAAELATLRGRVDALEARTSELEANQFSTTTKLNGEAIFALSDDFGGKVGLFGRDNRRVGSDNNEAVFQQRVRLNLNTSFTGRDLLLTRLDVGNGQNFNLGATREGTQTWNV